MAISTIKKPLTIKSGTFTASLTADSDNRITTVGQPTSVFTSGTLPNDFGSCFYIVQSVSVSNNADFSFHVDGSNRDSLYLTTNKTQNVVVRWFQFNY